MSLSDQFLRARGERRDFASTHWSVVLLAGPEHSPQSAAALEKLCRAYWYPLYSFTRRQGYGAHEAADLTQEFFSHLLATNALASVSPARGKFRSFLLASLKNLLANEWHRARRQKRGGGAQLFSLDEEAAEGRYQLDPADASTPDKIFERRWAETILSRALDRLRQECDGSEKTRRFDEVKTFLLGEKGTDTLAGAAARLNLSLAAAKGLVHRLRRRFREGIRDEIAQTVARPEEIDQEIRDLFAAFGG
ncbi:MAG: sigma-70 family RNA polymerase sigma factor [Verrucomicrobia bacterium]|nr:sigma-70 family RNA polymerase sigma factor [Verrucomicrobiota bacterium]